MKNFKDYLIESQKVYNYRIKIVGDIPTGFIKSMEEKLKQFDPVKIGETKTTPVQAKLSDFPAYDNDRVSHFDVEFRYPCIDAQVRQIAQILGLDPNRILMQTVPYADSNDEIADKVDDQPEALLADTDFPAPDAEQKASPDGRQHCIAFVRISRCTHDEGIRLSGYGPSSLVDCNGVAGNPRAHKGQVE